VVPASLPKLITRLSPAETGVGFEFESKVTGGNVPREFWPAVQKGFEMSVEKGPLAGFPVVDLKVTLKDGGFHPVDSSAIAFEIAARAAYRQSLPKAGLQLLEPIMKVDVFTPDDYMGDVIGDLNRRRGMILGQDTGPTGVRIKAEAPLSEMFSGYIGDLRTMTSGRGQFSMTFSHYAPCPNNVAEVVIKEAKERADRGWFLCDSRVGSQKWTGDRPIYSSLAGLYVSNSQESLS
jgi:elongation factor G